MLFYNNLCLSSVSNATLVIFLLNCFYSIINNTYPLSVKLVSKQFNGFCHSPQDFHLCIIQCSRTHCVRRSERSNCGCTGVSLSDRAVHGDKRGQVFYKNTNRVRSLLQGKGHGVFVSTASCLSNVLNCFIQLSKNPKEENHLSYIPRWKRGEM